MIGRLVATIALIAANGFFVASEFALIAVRESKVRHLAADGSRPARSLERSLGELTLMLAGAQLGITIASLLLGFVAEPLFAQLVEAVIGSTPWEPNETVIHTIAFILSLAIVVFLHMVFGEMVPKNFSIAEPERTALLVAIPFRVYVTIVRGIIIVLNAMSNLGAQLLGAEPVGRREVASSTQISAMLRESRAEGTLPALEHRVLRGALSFRDLNAEEIMTPRPDAVAAGARATPNELERLIRNEGKSRIPIYQGDLDDMLGFVHAKDLLTLVGAARNEPIRHDLIRDLHVVPEQASLLDVFSGMRAAHAHIALVVDEHGSTSGVLTLEDVLEELVGDIRDEYDRHEYKVWRIGSGRFLVDGSLRPDEIEDATGLALPEGEFETLGGFILERLGIIPDQGAVVGVDGWTLRVRTMDGFRIARVELVAPEPDVESESKA